MQKTRRSILVLLSALVLVGVCTAVTLAAPGTVKGWFKAGNDPTGYVIGTEQMDQGSVAYIKSLKPADNKFGTLMQSFLPDEYKGKRVRLSASVKTADVKNWVGMWMRVDADGKTVAFDNMQDRSITGTTDWKNYSIVLDVPQECDNMAMGLILSGAGAAYWDHLKLEVVGDDVPVTSNMGSQHKHPANLDFNN